MPPRSCIAVLVVAASALLVPSAQAENRWLNQRVLNFAHQGGEDELPSNTMYAFREALATGADALELDVGYTKDGHLVVLHDNGLDRTANGSGSVNDLDLQQVQRFDAAHWFVPGRGTVRGLPASRYPLRGMRTGKRRAPTGYGREDFRVPTLDEVLRTFKDVPLNIEVKGRDGRGADVYRRGAELLARALNRAKRDDVIAASFEEVALERLRALAPQVDLAPGTAGVANFLLADGSPGEGVAAFQIPITFNLGGNRLQVTTPESVAKAHERGFAVHTWLSNDREDDATYRRLLAMCVDGIMAAKPAALERRLRRDDVSRPGRKGGQDPCGTRVASASLKATPTVEVPIERRGLSLERRTGSIRVRQLDSTLATGRFVLASGARRATARIALRAQIGRASRATAEVTERGVVVSSRPVVLRP